MEDYRELGIKTYGTKCEFDGCGWDAAPCDVHHINYQEHQEFEEAIRKAIRMGDHVEILAQLLAEARDRGYLSYDRKTGQLAKDNRTTNLSVLCPNHHRYVHTVDMGMDILKHLPPRK